MAITDPLLNLISPPSDLGRAMTESAQAGVQLGNISRNLDDSIRRQSAADAAANATAFDVAARAARAGGEAIDALISRQQEDQRLDVSRGRLEVQQGNLLARQEEAEAMAEERLRASNLDERRVRVAEEEQRLRSQEAAEDRRRRQLLERQINAALGGTTSPSDDLIDPLDPAPPELGFDGRTPGSAPLYESLDLDPAAGTVPIDPSIIPGLRTTWYSRTEPGVDSFTAKNIGMANNQLSPHAIALSPDVAGAIGAQPGALIAYTTVDGDLGYGTYEDHTSAALTGRLDLHTSDMDRVGVDRPVVDARIVRQGIPGAGGEQLQAIAASNWALRPGAQQRAIAQQEIAAASQHGYRDAITVLPEAAAPAISTAPTAPRASTITVPEDPTQLVDAAELDQAVAPLITPQLAPGTATTITTTVDSSASSPLSAIDPGPERDALALVNGEIARLTAQIKIAEDQLGIRRESQSALARTAAAAEMFVDPNRFTEANKPLVDQITNNSMQIAALEAKKLALTSAVESKKFRLDRQLPHSEIRALTDEYQVARRASALIRNLRALPKGTLSPLQAGLENVTDKLGLASTDEARRAVIIEHTSLLNSHIKEYAGAAVSASEAERLFAELGKVGEMSEPKFRQAVELWAARLEENYLERLRPLASLYTIPNELKSLRPPRPESAMSPAEARETLRQRRAAATSRRRSDAAAHRGVRQQTLDATRPANR